VPEHTPPNGDLSFADMGASGQEPAFGGAVKPDLVLPSPKTPDQGEPNPLLGTTPSLEGRILALEQEIGRLRLKLEGRK